MATKFSKMVIYLDWLLPIESHGPLIMWSCKITWQTKTIISSLPQCLWPPAWQNGNLPWWPPAHSHMTLWSRGLVRPRDNLKSYFHYHSAYSHQTRQADDLPWETSTHSVTPSFGHVDLRDHVRKPLWFHYHSIYGHKTWQDGELPWLPFTHKVKWLYNHTVLWDQVTN